MSLNRNLGAVCSVSEMARRLCLSRSRFYQLLDKGVFPKPDPGSDIGRPFYTLDLQKKCMEIRRTGIGFNGQPVFFNAPRRTRSGKTNKRAKDNYGELANILVSMGLETGRKEVRDAVKHLYPNALAKGTLDDKVIREVFQYLHDTYRNDASSLQESRPQTDE